jgi:cathepsin D
MLTVAYLCSYYGSIAVGTPPVAYQVILDTGSADLFLVSSECVSSSCTGIPAFNPSSSSTFTSTTQPFSITYGSGSASGTLAKDVVQMAGFEVSSQVFGMSFHPTACPLHGSLTIFILQPYATSFLTNC